MIFSSENRFFTSNLLSGGIGFRIGPPLKTGGTSGREQGSLNAHHPSERSPCSCLVHLFLVNLQDEVR
jgi:hypothetical protein